MEANIRKELIEIARKHGKEYGMEAELDFGAGAEWMYKRVIYKSVTEIEKENENVQ